MPGLIIGIPMLIQLATLQIASHGEMYGHYSSLWNIQAATTLIPPFGSWEEQVQDKENQAGL